MEHTNGGSATGLVVSCNVALPCEIKLPGGAVNTGIFKKPVAGRVRVTLTNLAGDGQADLSVHGGIHKAVYVYPYEHYEFWTETLGEPNLPWGAFGENLTTSGLDEESISIGDQLRIGSALFQVTQPRLPCYKLGLRFGRLDIIKFFHKSHRSGFYLSVLEPGEVQEGDTVTIFPAEPPSILVTELLLLYRQGPTCQELLQRALQSRWLIDDWKDYFRQRYA